MAYMPCHDYQRRMVNESSAPILNAASKEDPGNLGRDYNATNLDIEDYDIETKTSLYSIPNFVRGSALNLPFPDGKFGCVVLGEFLEHCFYEDALLALQEAHRVLRKDGRLVLTFPQDNRPKEIQRSPDQLRVYESRITSWHQTVWTWPDLHRLFAESGFDVVSYEDLRYVVCDWAGQECMGLGVFLRKADPCSNTENL